MTVVLDNCISAALRESTDADLVRLTRVGEPGAFDLLVMRHRASVLYAARAGVRDWEQAEDVAQQALVEAYKSLRGLREGTSFRAWLMTITRRCASRHREREASQPDAVELTEAVICFASPPEIYPGIDDVTERVRASLSELSARSRQVVTLHYLDGYSCKEIGSRLGLPEGTVKRILHESRNDLRSRMGVAAGGVGRMGVTDKHKTSTKGPRRMMWWVNGNWPGSMFQTLLAQSIALAISKQPMTIEEIAGAVDANPRFVDEALAPLVKEELVVKIGGKYATNFIALSAEDWIEMTKGAREQAKELADLVQKHVPILEEAWNRTLLPGQGFPWSKGIWPMLAVLVCDVAVSRNSTGGPSPGPMHPSGCPYWAGGREIVDEKHMLWSTGFALADVPDLSFWYGYWHIYFSFYKACGGIWDWGRHDNGLAIAAIAEGASNIESVAKRTGKPLELVREAVALAIQAGLVKAKGESLSLTFPVLGPPEDGILTPVIDGVATRLVHDILEPATDDAFVRLRDLGYGRLEQQFPAWRRWLQGDIAGECLRELVGRGVLPDPGNPAPLAFTTVGWFEKQSRIGLVRTWK